MNGNLFEVVAVDEERNTVELQHFDGTIEGLDMETWMDTGLEGVQAPEDWSGSVDIDPEDLPDPENHPQLSWQSPLELLDRLD